MYKETYYWTCPKCHANLDPGEKCDCDQPINIKDTIDYSDVKPLIYKKENIKEDIQMKAHPLSVNNSNGFVSVSDITGVFVEHNKVLFNPLLPRVIRMEYLQKVTFEYFHFTFTPEQLSHLVDDYGMATCDEFIDEFRKLKKDIKHEDW